MHTRTARCCREIELIQNENCAIPTYFSLFLSLFHSYLCASDGRKTAKRNLGKSVPHLVSIVVYTWERHKERERERRIILWMRRAARRCAPYSRRWKWRVMRASVWHAKDMRRVRWIVWKVFDFLCILFCGFVLRGSKLGKLLFR